MLEAVGEIEKGKTMKTNLMGRTPKRHEDTLYRREEDNSIVIMQMTNADSYFTLKGLSCEIWELIDGRNTLEGIQDTIKNKYPVPNMRFKRDLKQLFDRLEKESLIYYR